ncbi:hypothetical protein BZJ19_13075 [Salinivibrio proteolyticus]|uniref:DUF805 domain-containing protein n=1 Tax=Salinivibrio TaxID=51366 RepID=UPI0009871FC4|nr:MULTISPECIES: DUF805 domain-containing protein [Salinivibrio]OOF10533.1 hypothetical protein BZG83_13685 [Salinivibrio sp. PR919]OOF15010.1 hypothetical protein BZG84_13300 [Salinivibrio sp. PR932]OOF23180.1 hypothetical protein BZJ19_13075 [Salinivibrio proteolyticus]OOF30396.1 hypothetical protein BZJ20_11060 [Salinivibrio proteolyticus]
MEWYLKVLRQYATFSGRAHRQEYWMFFLVNFCISLAINIVAEFSGLVVLSMVYSLALLLPTLAVTSRRLHDTGRSAWWLLLLFIPLLGMAVILVLCALEGDQNSNQYGSNPKLAEGV